MSIFYRKYRRMPMNKKVIVSILILTVFASSCAYTRFARVQKSPLQEPVAADDVRIYLNSKPTGNYTEIGLIEGHPGAFSRKDTIFRKMRERAAKEGAVAIVNLRASQSININVDTDDPSMSAYPKTVYYGDAVVFVEDSDGEATTNTKTTDQIMKQYPRVRAGRGKVRVSVPTN